MWTVHRHHSIGLMQPASGTTYLEKPLVVVNHGMDTATFVLRVVKGCLYMGVHTLSQKMKKVLHDACLTCFLLNA